MATPTIKGGSFGKEKKGIYPSNPLSKKTGSSSSPSSSSLVPKSNEKPVPNYLKPTMSSSLDFSRLAKKSTFDNNASQKPVLNRRRSFDRPPRVSEVRKPGPSSDRIYARASSTLKPTIITKGTKKQLKNVTFESNCVNRPTSNRLVIEDDFVGIDSEIQSLPEISEMPDSDQELGDPAYNSRQIENEGTSENVDQVMEQNVRQETVKLGNKLEEKYKKAVETKSKAEIAAEIVIFDHKLNEKHEKAVETKSKAEIAAEIVKLDHKLDEKEEKAVEIKPKAEIAAEIVSDENPSVLSHSTTSKAKIIEIVPKTIPSEQTSSSQSSSRSNNLQISDGAPAKAAGKKEKQEYNTVIEETVSKLSGSKSKVWALAGAFEAVISLEGTKKK